MRLISLALPCFLTFSLVFAESMEQDPDEYYGVPLGALHYSAAGTSAEVYAADEYTVVFNHFTHHPKKLGCTAMMIGPPRSEDTEDVIPGHGILIGIAQPLLTLKRRAKRQFGLWQSFSNWPRELGHLLMKPENDQKKSGAVEAAQNSFSGIHIQQDSDRPIKNITIQASTTAATTKAPFTTTVHRAVNVSREPTTTTATTTNSPAVSVVTTRPIIRFDNKGPIRSSVSPPETSRSTAIRWSASAESAEGPGMLVMNPEERFYRKPNNVNPRFFGPLPRRDGHLSTENPLLGVDTSEFVRRAPSQRTFTDFKALGQPHFTPAPIGTVNTPLFWVIPDPHEKRRQERLKQMRYLEAENPRPTTTTPPPPPINSRFELPEITDKAAAFTLTNGAKVTDYLWIGLYDQCDKQSIPLISLKGVDPPREERIAPMSGWSHNVTSYRVQILNCNTILIPGFIYDDKNTTSNTFFFVGVGQFPHKIEHQVKALVVGQMPNEPLRSYAREDVLLRLPKSYRTFDIDFISVFNVDEQQSYGHVLLPSLLVPPCAED